MTPIPVPDRMRERMARACDLPFALFHAAPTLADGEVALLTTRTHDALALAVVDRAAMSWRIMARAPSLPATLDEAWADRCVADAVAAREFEGLPAPDRAYRVLNGAGDGTPGVLADIYGGWAVVSALTPAVESVAHLMAQGLLRRQMARGAVVKRRPRGRAGDGPAVAALLGEPPPERLVVTEGPWRFEVHLTTGVNVGLFTDMRLERARITALARGRRVLNLFAYTGALSVAAAAGGAVSVTSVDLSEGVLAWARDNFALNGLSADLHHPVAADVSAYLAGAALRDERFDLVLIDPPSFSTARAAEFAIGRDYPALMSAACRVLAPGGHLWVASNTRGFSLIGAAQLAISDAGRVASVQALGGLPPDYPTELSDTDARYLQTCVLRVA